MRLATIDIGTNTTLLLVAEVQNGHATVLAERAEITRLGRGIGGKKLLGKEGMDATLAVLAEYRKIAADLGAPLFAIGTEGLRRAENASEFLAPAATVLGSPVDVIDGDREAALTFFAARRSFPIEAGGRLIVIDIGGGSTEVILSEGSAITFRTSLPLGSVRLTERHIKTDPADPAEWAAIRNEIRSRLNEVPFSAKPTLLVGTAGTVTTLAAMAQDLRSYDPALVHGYKLTGEALAAQIARLSTATQTARETMPGLDPRRADVILAGACILDEIAVKSGSPHVLVSDRGIRWGLLFEKAESLAAATLHR
jgi:exopolyphosphatase / guanosine-5'-triphosphate,3'-diphosphate pyrophosphatase